MTRGAHRNAPARLKPRWAFRVWPRGAALLILVVAAVLAAPARPAAAHAFLESSDPEANAVVATAPRTVTLRFTEPLEASYSRAELVDQTGEPVSGAVSRVEASDPWTMTVEIPPGLGNGTYSLLWRTLSTADGHTAQGYLPFTVGTEADIAPVATPSQESLSILIPDGVYAASRWLALLGLAAVVAIWPVWLFVVRPALSPVWQLGPQTTRRARRFAAIAIGFALAADVVALLVQAMAIAGPWNVRAGLPVALGETRYGTWWLVRVGLVLLFAAALLGAAWWRPWRQRWATLLALGVAAALPLPFSMLSHAGAQTMGRATALAFDYVHLLGASLWAGGLLVLIVTLGPLLANLTPAGRRVVLGRAIPRFSLLALIAWGVMALTGFYAAWLQVGNLPGLTETPYGQALLLKLILIVPLLLLGAFNLLVVTRRLQAAETEEAAEGWSKHFVTALISEAVIVTLLLGVVGVLIGTPTARLVLEQQANSLRIPLEGDGQTGTLIITPGTVGQNRYRLEFGSGHEAHLQNPAIVSASLRFELPSRGTGQLEIPLAPALEGGYEGQGSELAFPGAWNVQVTVREPTPPDWVVPATAQVTADPAPSQAPPPPPVFGPAGIAALALLVAGIAGIVFAIFGRAPSFRKEAIGLGAAAIVVGLVLLLQARLTAGDATAADLPADLLTPPDPAAVERGAALFAQSCVACHGPGGRGDGPLAASLARPPTDLTTGHALPHPNAVYAEWIANGIAGTDMPAFGDELNDEQIADVIAYVRSLQQTALLARDAPGAEDCTVEPRSLEEIAALAERGAPDEPPNATETGDEPVDDATRAKITATARELIACANAGDVMRQLALYSDDRLRFSYPEGPTRELETIAQAASPLSLEQRVAVAAIEDARWLDDGRVSARMLVDNPAIEARSSNGAASASGREAARLIFVQEDGRWRVDETRREDTQTDATPVAGTAGP